MNTRKLPIGIQDFQDLRENDYLKPLLQALEKAQPNEEIRDRLKAFYGALKRADAWLRFVLLTGVTKFSQVIAFSDLNDISMDCEYAAICGISALEKLKKFYNGYHFCKQDDGISNPFSVLNVLDKREFSFYWFKSGTPTFLIKRLKNQNFDPLRFEEGISISANSITDYCYDSNNLVPLLYQNGYLSIKSYDRQLNTYTLGFPNDEVKYGFLEKLLSYYIGAR